MKKKKIYTQFLQNVSKPPVPGIEPGVTRPESNALPPSTRDFDEMVSILLQYKVLINIFLHFVINQRMLLKNYI